MNRPTEVPQFPLILSYSVPRLPSVFYGKFQGDVRTPLYFYCKIMLQLVMIGGRLKHEVSTQIVPYPVIYNTIFLVVLC